MVRLSAALALAALVGFNPPAAPVAPSEPDENALYRQTLSGVAWVVTTRSAQEPALAAEFEGTAWVADDGLRLLVTNYHIVDAARVVRVHFPVQDRTGALVANRDWYEANQAGVVARVVAANPLKDLAVIQVKHLPTGVKSLKLAGCAAKPGELAHCVGIAGPKQNLWVCSNGSVGGVFQLITDDGKFSGRVFESSIAAGPGASGSPVVNAAGEVWGVMFAKRGSSRPVTLIVDVVELKPLLEEAARTVAQLDSRVGR